MKILAVICTLVSTLFLLPLTLLATDCIPNCTSETDWTLEVRGAYYYLPNKKVKKNFTGDWIDYQVETAKRVHPFVEVWGGICWATKHGHTRERYGSESHKFKDKETIFVLPVSAGVKLIYPILPRVDAYVGAGVCYSFLKMKNFCKEHYSDWGLSHSPFKKVIYRNQFGAVFKVGFQIALSDSTFLDFFVDYYAQRFKISGKKKSEYVIGRNLDCSGFKFGGGFGVYF